MAQQRNFSLKAFLNSVKSKMTFSGFGGTGGSFGLSQTAFDTNDNFIRNVAAWWSRYSGTDIDYAKEVGDLLQSSLVMAAVNWVARALPEAKLTVVTFDKDGKEVPVPNHPAITLLNRPNPYFSGATMWQAFAISWLIDGNCYWLKARDGYNRVQELWYAPSFMMEPRWPLDGSMFVSHYAYNVDGLITNFAPQDVIHFRNGINPYNMRLGLSPVASVLREIYSDSQAMNYQSLMLTQGILPPAVLSVKATDNGMPIDADPAAIKKQFQEATQGDQRGKVFVSNIPVELSKISFTPSELDLKALRAMPEERFAAVIGIPAIVLGFGAGMATSTYNNTEQADERAYENYMVPLWRVLEEELTAQLMPEFSGSQGYRFKFDLRTVRALSLDEDALYKRLTVAYKGNWIKKSEARAQAGLIVSPEDEVYFSDEQAAQKAADAERQLQIAEAQAQQQQMQPAPGQRKLKPQEQEPAGQQQGKPQTKSLKAAFSIAMIVPPATDKAEILEFANNTFLQADWQDEAHGIEDDTHITIKYGILSDNPLAVANAVAGFGAFDIEIMPTAQMITDSGLLCYFPVKSEKLTQLYKVIAEATSHRETFENYLPHISLCWLNSDAFHSERYVGLASPVKSFTVSEITFSDTQNNRVTVDLTCAPSETGLELKALPGKTEIDAAAEYWQQVAPQDALELINAK